MGDEVALLAEDVHESEPLQGAAGGQVLAGGAGGEGEEGTVHAPLGDHLHDGVAAAGAGVAHAGPAARPGGEGGGAAGGGVRQRAPVYGEVLQSIIVFSGRAVLYYRVGGDGGGVAGPEQDVPAGVAAPGHLLLVQDGHQHGAGPDRVPGNDAVVQFH